MSLHQLQIYQYVLNLVHGVELEDEVELILPESLLTLRPVSHFLNPRRILLLERRWQAVVTAQHAVFVVYVFFVILLRVYSTSQRLKMASTVAMMTFGLLA